MRVWLASLALAACSTTTSPPRPEPATPVAPIAPTPAPSVRWPELNLGFEQVTGDQPSGWASRTSYHWAAVSEPRHGGAYSARLRASGRSPWGTLIASVPADRVRGKHLVLRGWIKTEAASGSAAMFVRVEGGGGAFDNMADRAITGTADWSEASVEVDVPERAERIVFGPVLTGEGTAWFDDLQFEVSERAKPRPIALEGTVVDAAGEPVAGADVALVGAAKMHAHVRSGVDGRFRFDAMPGTWGFSAHRAGQVGGFVDRKRFDDDARTIQVTLGAGAGVVVRGTLAPGKPAAGAYATIGLQSQHTGDLFAVPVEADGTFVAILPRAISYSARILGGVGTGRPVGDRADIAVVMPALGPPPREVVDWIAAHASALATVEPGQPLDDLAPLGKLIGNARVVGLGEATHGTREFFQLKHRVLEYLVERHGFTVFAIEANQPECRAINDYVLHGTGDPRTALDGIYFWIWNTEEVLAMIEWMRAWNADPGHRNKVQFIGFDIQTTRVAYANVAAFLANVAPDAAPALLAPIEVLGGPQPSAAIAKQSAGEHKRITDGLAAIAKVFDAGRATWSRTTAAAELDDVRHDLTILEQATELYVAPPANDFNVRDRAMAANIQWILAHQPPGTRMVVWAHNGHVGLRSYAGERLVTMGSHLRRQLKASYVNLGFMFSHGSYQAIEPAARPGVHEITLDEPPEHHAGAAFARTGKPLLLLDLRSLPARGAVHDWFVAPHPLREADARFYNDVNLAYPNVLPALYDTVIFVERTTRARPLHPHL